MRVREVSVLLLYCSLIRSNRFVDFASGVKRVAEVVVSLRVPPAPLLNRRPIGVDCLIDFAQIVKSYAEVVPRGREGVSKTGRRLVKACSSFFERAAFIQRKPKVVMRDWIIGLLSDRSSIRCNRRIEITHVIKHTPEIAVRFGELRIRSQRRAKRSNRRVQITKFVKRAPEHVMRFSKLFPVTCDHGLASLGDSGQVAVVIQRPREIQVSLRKYRLLLNRPTKLADRLLELARLVQGDSQTMMRPGHLLLLSNGSAKLDDRFVELSRLQQRVTKAVMCSGKLFVLSESRAIRLDRFVELVDS